MEFDIDRLREHALAALQFWHSHPEANAEPSFMLTLNGHITSKVPFRWIFLEQRNGLWYYACHAQDILDYVLEKEATNRAIEATRKQLTNQFKN